MKYTSAEANKLLKKLNEEKSMLLDNESRSATFSAALGEDVESVRPEYDYFETDKKLEALNADIRKVKHAINVFNTTHAVPGFDMTIDEMLVYIPQLTAKKARLLAMSSRLPKERKSVSGYGTNAVIDYLYANYDVSKAAEDYGAVSELLSRAQTALDIVNSTETMEIDI